MGSERSQKEKARRILLPAQLGWKRHRSEIRQDGNSGAKQQIRSRNRPHKAEIERGQRKQPEDSSRQTGPFPPQQEKERKLETAPLVETCTEKEPVCRSFYKNLNELIFKRKTNQYKKEKWGSSNGSTARNKKQPQQRKMEVSQTINKLHFL